jgi:hypothetical protein
MAYFSGSAGMTARTGRWAETRVGPGLALSSADRGGRHGSSLAAAGRTVDKPSQRRGGGPRQ